MVLPPPSPDTDEEESGDFSPGALDGTGVGDGGGAEQPVVPPPSAGTQANLTSYAWPGLSTSWSGVVIGSGRAGAASPAVWSTTLTRELSVPPCGSTPISPPPSTEHAVSEVFTTRNEP